MDIGSIIILAIVVGILVKTGSISKVLGFLLRYAFLPGIFGLIGFLFLNVVGLIIGIIAGLVVAFKYAQKNIKGD